MQKKSFIKDIGVGGHKMNSSLCVCTYGGMHTYMLPNTREACGVSGCILALVL